MKYEITPVWDSYRPIYAKMDLDKKELSNILVYNMKQYGNDLIRIKNHVENKLYYQQVETLPNS